MRLSKDEVSGIKQVIQQADPDARVWLFGSRVDDAARGGDIDLLILSDTLAQKDKIALRLRLYEVVGVQKIDLVIAVDDSEPFTRIALAEGVQL